jgi:hypothetical protein
MKKYLVLYQAEGAPSAMSVSEMFARSTPEQLHRKRGWALGEPGTRRLVAQWWIWGSFG